MSKAKTKAKRRMLMELQLKNIGMIKEANVKMDGLTVIAGENDTGKSTVGKILYICIKSLNDTCRSDKAKDDTRQVLFNIYIEKLFHHQISKDGGIKLSYGDELLAMDINDNRCVTYKETESPKKFSSINKPLFIETPLIWTIFPLIKTVRNVKLESFLSNIDFQITPTLEDLYVALTMKMSERNKISLEIEDIIGGTFEENSIGDYRFYKNNIPVELVNTAMGIKLFGILQVLHNNNHLQEGQILILDEPEVHLHPKWQLKMAEVIVNLVKNGVKIVVNSHSPYMIDALKYYADEYKINNNFYLAHKNEDETSSMIDVTMDISPIFEALTEPLRELRKMKLGLD